MPNLKPNIAWDPSDNDIPLVELASELRRLGAQPPSCGVLRNAGYSGAFPIGKRGRNLVVPRDQLSAIAALYRPTAPVRIASAA